MNLVLDLLSLTVMLVGVGYRDLELRGEVCTTDNMEVVYLFIDCSCSHDDTLSSPRESII